MKNNLEKYFAKYNSNLAHIELMNDEQVIQILKEAPQKGSFNLNNKQSNLQRKTIMNTIIVSAVIGLLWYSSTLFQNIENINVSKNVTEQTDDDTYVSTSISNNEELNQNEPQTQKSHLYVHKQIVYLDYYNAQDNIVEIPLLKLNDIELQTLGIKKTGDFYTVLIERYYAYESSDLQEHYNNPFAKNPHPGLFTIEDYKKMRYPTIGILRENLEINIGKFKPELSKYNDWNMFESSIVSPVMISQNYKTENSFGSQTYGGYTPQFDYTNFNMELFEELNEYKSYILNSLKETNFENISSNNFIIQLNSNEYKYLDKFCVVLLVSGDKNNYAYTLLFYPATNQLLEKLPIKQKQIISSNCEIMQFISTREYFKSDLTVEIPDKDITTSSTSGLNKIYLSDNELAKLGIIKEVDTYTLFIDNNINLSEGSIEQIKKISDLGYNTSKEEITITVRALINNDGFSSDEQSILTQKEVDDLAIHNIQPISITSVSKEYFRDNRTGNYHEIISTGWLMFDHKDLQYFTDIPISTDGNIDYFEANSNFIIPVSFNVGITNSTDSSDIKYSDITLWYYLSEEFIELLPIRYKGRLIKELQLYMDYKEGLLQHEELCGEINKQSILDLCTSLSSAMEIRKVYPLPAKYLINCELEIKNPSSFLVNLSDISGNKVKELIPMENYKNGKQTIKVDIGDVPQGVYLLIFEFENGDKVNTKIIIN